MELGKYLGSTTLCQSLVGVGITPSSAFARTIARRYFLCLCDAGVTTQRKAQHISEPRVNERIRVPEVRLVGPTGERVGSVRVEDALRSAQEPDRALVEVARDARPPVCQLMACG